MRWALVIGLGLLTVLALVAHAQAVVSPPTSGYYCYWRVDLNSSGYVVVVDGSQGTYNLAVLTQQEYETWSGGRPTPAVYYSTVSYGAVLAIPVGAGDYVAVVYPLSSPTCPSIGIGGKEYLPIGIASYPLTPITTSELMGFFNITAINAYNPSGESQFGVLNTGASLQFNAVLVVELANGQVQYYWMQDLLQFITNEMQVRAVDSITNLTSTPSILLNQTIRGNGNVYISSRQNYYYFYGTSFSSYSPPFAGYLIMKAYASGGVAHVDFGYVIIQNGFHYPPWLYFIESVIVPTVVLATEVIIALWTSEYVLGRVVLSESFLTQSSALALASSYITSLIAWVGGGKPSIGTSIYTEYMLAATIYVAIMPTWDLTKRLMASRNTLARVYVGAVITAIAMPALVAAYLATELLLKPPIPTTHIAGLITTVTLIVTHHKLTTK
jgi:hypothetical protein